VTPCTLVAMPEARRIHHLTLTVTDLDVSVAWYERVLGLQKANERQGPTWVRTIVRNAHGLVIGLTVHESGRAVDRFDERRVGLDHLSIACDDLDEMAAWKDRLDELQVPNDGIVETPYAHVLVARDPDNIPVEFFTPHL